MGITYQSKLTGKEIDSLQDFLANKVLSRNLISDNTSFMIKTKINNFVSPEENTYSGGTFQFQAADKDSNGKTIVMGYLQAFKYNNGTQGMMIAGRQVCGTNTKTNYIRLGVTTDGDGVVILSHPAAWREALSIFPTTGGIMSGSLQIDNNYSVLINSNIKNDSDPTEDTYSGTFQIRTNDSDRVAVGFIQAFKYTTGTQGINLNARKRIGDNNYNCSLKLYVNSDKKGIGEFSGSMTFTNNNTAKSDEFNFPALVIGGKSTNAHIEIDSNKIMAKGSATALASLWLQNTIEIPKTQNQIRMGTGYIGSYIKCTRNAAFCVAADPNTNNGAISALSVRTPSGGWSINTYTAEALQFTYGTTTNFNSNTNTTITAKITAAGAFTNASRRELKENIEEYNVSAIDIIKDTKICSFNMKGDPEQDFRVGFIADDTNPVLSGKNQDVMDTQNCIGVLLKAIQELQAEIDELKQQIHNE